MPSSSHQSRVYRGEALRAVAMPLGGIGTGTIALAGDGSLRQWQIHNQINHLACVPHSFFAVWARPHRPSNAPVARVLQSAALYDHDGPVAPPPTVNDHVVPDAARRLLQELPGVATTAFTGEYPIAEVTYHDEALSLDVQLEAFNPFIPLDPDDSGLPAIVFNLTVGNATDKRLQASVAASLQNAVGWDGMASIFDTACPHYGGNSNTLIRTATTTTIAMSTARLPEEDAGFGTMALSALSPEATAVTQWSDLRAFWDDFASDGRLGPTHDATPSPAGRTWNGALAVPFRLQPGERRTITFVLAWHFPNRYVNWSQRPFFNFPDEKSKFWLGNRYAVRFRSALAVTTYVEANLPRLASQTRLARDTFNDTTLPAPLIDAVTSQMSIIRTPTCFWTEDGAFYGFEGGCGASTAHHTEPTGGSCPLNCTHVWNYEMALSRLFPALERTMRDTEWQIQQHPSGYLPHRVLMPTYLPRPWDRPMGGPEEPALDGLLGAILKTLREYRASGDDEGLARAWPAVRRALDHLWTAHDSDRAGVIRGEQPNTYDISIYGLNTFIGTLYLAALRAAAVMARTQGEERFAAECEGIAVSGGELLDARLWNGEYYVQEVDLDRYPEQNWVSGCHSDHLLGQWWASLLDLGPLLDPAHLHTAARSIERHNFRPSLRGLLRHREYATEEDGGLVVCTWPHGGRPDIPTRYSDEVWTGLEYEVAALLLCEGQAEAALRILAACRARHDGRTQNPWNDVECGDHYVRALASWSLLEAASGYRYHAATHALAFAPTLDAADFRAPFVARDGYGTFAQQHSGDGLEATITLTAGTLTMQTLRLRPPATVTAGTAQMADREVAVALTQSGEDAVLTMSEPLTLQAGQHLEVALG